MALVELRSLGDHPIYVDPEQVDAIYPSVEPVHSCIVVHGLAHPLTVKGATPYVYGLLTPHKRTP